LICHFSEETLPIANFLISSVSFLCFHFSFYLVLFFSLSIFLLRFCLCLFCHSFTLFFPHLFL
jgi:hypothetical protein